MNACYAKVREFQTAFGQPVAVRPRLLSAGDSTFDKLDLLAAHDVLVGASERLKYAASNDLGGRVMKRSAWMAEELAEFMAAGTITDQADAMIDLIYLALGTLVEMGVQPEPIFNIVHAANMSKLGADGKPIIVDGKVRKPDGWQAPEALIAEEIEQQSFGNIVDFPDLRIKD